MIDDEQPPRARLDVSHLPEATHGPRTPLWWGVALMVTIESTMFVLALASFFYIRQNYHVWPPTPPGAASVHSAILGLLAMVASLLPMVLCARAATHERVFAARRWLIVGTVLGAVFLALRVVELHNLPFRWDSHAYGSVFWVTLGLHTFHGLTSVAENLLLITLLFRGPVEEEHLTDVEVTCLYWYFVVGWLAVIDLVFYLVGNTVLVT